MSRTLLPLHGTFSLRAGNSLHCLAPHVLLTFKKKFTYSFILAELGLSCGTRDLLCGMRDLFKLRQADFLVAFLNIFIYLILIQLLMDTRIASSFVCYE